MSHKIEIVKKVDAISNRDSMFSDYNDDISFNFDDDLIIIIMTRYMK